MHHRSRCAALLLGASFAGCSLPLPAPASASTAEQSPSGGPAAPTCGERPGVEVTVTPEQRVDPVAEALFPGSEGVVRYGHFRLDVRVITAPGVATAAEAQLGSLRVPLEPTGEQRSACVEHRYSGRLSNTPWLPQGFGVRVTATDVAGGAQEVRRDVGWYATRLDAVAVVSGPGVLWAATPKDGLLGLSDDAPGGAPVRSVDYPGGELGSERAGGAVGPQGSVLLSMAAGPAGTLWLGSWARGLSWFDPGPDPFSRLDDQWRHGVPPSEGLDGLAVELRETITALLADDDGAFVGTLDGLYRVDGAAEGSLAWRRILDGQVLSLAHGSDGWTWVGLTTELTPAGQVPASSAALVAVRGDDVREPAATPQSSVMALALDAGAVWVGGDAGLSAVDEADLLGAEPVTWTTWTELPDADVRAIVAEGGGVLWIGAFDVCGSDGGALMRLDHGGTPHDPADDVWHAWTQAEGLEDADVTGIAVLAPGRVAFTSFNLRPSDLAVDLLGADALRHAVGCATDARPPGGDGVTVLDVGRGPEDRADDVIFDY